MQKHVVLEEKKTIMQGLNAGTLFSLRVAHFNVFSSHFSETFNYIHQSPKTCHPAFNQALTNLRKRIDRGNNIQLWSEFFGSDSKIYAYVVFLWPCRI